MKNEAIDIRQLDSLGRVVIPKKMRTALHMSENDNLKISLEGNAIVIRRDDPVCVICKRDRELIDIADAYICASCAREISSKL